jgi:hypothetical protein
MKWTASNNLNKKEKKEEAGRIFLLPVSFQHPDFC